MTRRDRAWYSYPAGDTSFNFFDTGQHRPLNRPSDAYAPLKMRGNIEIELRESWQALQSARLVSRDGGAQQNIVGPCNLLGQSSIVFNATSQSAYLHAHRIAKSQAGTDSNEVVGVLLSVDRCRLARNPNPCTLSYLAPDSSLVNLRFLHPPRQAGCTQSIGGDAPRQNGDDNANGDCEAFGDVYASEERDEDSDPASSSVFVPPRPSVASFVPPPPLVPCPVVDTLTSTIQPRSQSTTISSFGLLDKPNLQPRQNFQLRKEQGIGLFGQSDQNQCSPLQIDLTKDTPTSASTIARDSPENPYAPSGAAQGLEHDALFDEIWRIPTPSLKRSAPVDDEQGRKRQRSDTIDASDSLYSAESPL